MRGGGGGSFVARSDASDLSSGNGLLANPPCGESIRLFWKAFHLVISCAKGPLWEDSHPQLRVPISGLGYWEAQRGVPILTHTQVFLRCNREKKSNNKKNRKTLMPSLSFRGRAKNSVRLGSCRRASRANSRSWGLSSSQRVACARWRQAQEVQMIPNARRLEGGFVWDRRPSPNMRRFRGCRTYKGEVCSN